MPPTEDKGHAQSESDRASNDVYEAISRLADKDGRVFVWQISLYVGTEMDPKVVLEWLRRIRGRGESFHWVERTKMRAELVALTRQMTGPIPAPAQEVESDVAPTARRVKPRAAARSSEPTDLWE